MELTLDIASALDAGRQRTLDLLAPFDDDFLRAQHSRLMSPLVWDLAHIGNYEEIWLVRALGGDGLRPDLDDLYDAFRHPRAGRPALPLLSPDEARSYIAAVRERALGARGRHLVRPSHGRATRASTRRDDAGDDPVVGDRIRAPTACRSNRRPAAPSTSTSASLSSGRATMRGRTTTNGLHTRSNSRRTRSIGRPFATATTSSSSPRVATTIPACGPPRAGSGGRRRTRVAPLFWRNEGGADWSVLRFGHRQGVDPAEPVEHVCWYEADAYARWAGQRLPTEHEWEAAHRRGVLDGVGQVWEWTQSDFARVARVRGSPVPRVLRGVLRPRLQGAARRLVGDARDRAADRRSATGTIPIRRQIFSGFRCARDAA